MKIRSDSPARPSSVPDAAGPRGIALVPPLAPAGAPGAADAGGRAPASAAAALTPGETTLSTPGRVVSELRQAARGAHGGIRHDVVAAIRKEIADGTFGGPEDTERTIDALLEDL